MIKLWENQQELPNLKWWGRLVFANMLVKIVPVYMGTEVGDNVVRNRGIDFGGLSVGRLCIGNYFHFSPALED